MHGARGSTAHLTGGGSGRSMAPLVMACAPAEAPPGLSGWAWLASLSWPRFSLVLLGYATAGAVTFWPVLNTFMGAWHMQAVGRGTRGEPFLLSLLSYTCALYLSLMSNGWQLDDSVWINGLGALFYVVYLVLFLRLADEDHRRTTLSVWVVAGAVVYLGLVAGIGVATESTDAVQWMCTLVALAATCVPLALAYFVMDRYLENLPDWLSSTVGLLYSVVWFALGLVPEPDYHALGQNATGAVCCLLFLVLLTRWPSNPAAGADQNDPLFDYHAIEAPHEVVNEGAKPPLVAEQKPLVEDPPPPPLVAEQQPPLVAEQKPLVEDPPPPPLVAEQKPLVEDPPPPPLVAEQKPLVEDPPPPPLVAEQQPLVAVQQPLVADPVPLVADPQGAIPPPAAV